MRIMRLALTGVAVALTGMPVVCIADPAFAASKKGLKGCTGKYQAYQNGECITTTDVNPDRVPSPQYYRSSSKKKTSSNWRDTPIPNQSAQLFRQQPSEET
jgi:hypothetical protein